MPLRPLQPVPARRPAAVAAADHDESITIVVTKSSKPAELTDAAINNFVLDTGALDSNSAAGPRDVLTASVGGFVDRALDRRAAVFGVLSKNP